MVFKQVIYVEKMT